MFAQAPSFTATVSKQNVAVGEQFEVSFSLNGNGDRFEPPNFNGFQVLSGPNVSNSITSINGNTTVSNAFSYIIAAVKEGKVNIGPATIYVNGRLLATTPITMTVTKGQPQRQGNRQQAQGAVSDHMDEISSADVAKQLFIKAVVDKSKVFQGEQLNVSYRLFTRVDILQSQLDKLPDLNGFFGLDINDPKNAKVEWKTEILNGIKYNVADLKQTILIPERTGDLTIDPMGMTLMIREPAPAKDVMEEFFGGSFRNVKVKIKSEPVLVHVKPLPTAGKPADYGGAVGAFTLETNVDRTALKANEAMNFNIKVTGTGNIKLIKDVAVNFPPDFEKYDPKVTDTVNKATGKMTGSRLYNYLLIPRHEGNYTIDPVKFSYFNPATQRYVTLTSKPIQIAVAKGKVETNVSALSAADKQDIKLLAKDIRYIKTDDKRFSKTGDTFFGSLTYFLLLLLGPILFIAAVYYKKWEARYNSDVVKVRSRKASKLAAKHLADAKKQLANKNKKGFYEVLFKGIYGYLSYKLNIPYANLDKEIIADALRKKSVSEALIARLEDTLDLCDMARFAPVSGIAEQEMFDKAKNMINDIEDEI